MLALGLLAGTLTMFVLLLVLPAFTLWHELTLELPVLRQQADGYSRLIARQAEIGRALTDRRAELAASADYLAAADPAIAAAQVQRDLGVRAETAGVAVRTTLTLPPTTVGGFTGIVFQLNVSGTLRSLRDFLYAIEAGQPRLVVDHLLLRADQAEDTTDTAPVYEMTLDVHGYMQETGVQ